VAKSKAAPDRDAAITIEFARTGNPWIDAGIVGLYRVLEAEKKTAYVDPPAKYAEETAATFLGAGAVELGSDGLRLTGPVDRLQACLESAYDRLIATYFNISSKKQLDDKRSYNFYLDSAKKTFVTFAKRKAAGAALLLFDKAARPSRDQQEWGRIADAKGKLERTPGRMPPGLESLQDALDRFLAENQLKAGPPAGLLIDGPNQVRPKVEIRVADHSARPKSLCFMSGEPGATFIEAKETAFPLLGGSRSFINGVDDWPRMGWKIDLVGKFVPAVAFFYQQGDDIHLFFPESNDLRRVDEMTDRLARMVEVEPNLFRNFDIMLGAYFQRRSEVALAFLHRVFVALSGEKAARRAEAEEAMGAEDTLEPDEDEGDEAGGADPGDTTSTSTPAPPISFEAVFDALRRGGDIRFTVVSASKKGNVWMARDFTTFRDVDRIARLFEAMQRRIETSSGQRRWACDPKKLFLALTDFEQKVENRTLVRDRFCDAVLGCKGVLGLIERHAFHVNTHSDPGKARPVGSLLDFARLYELDLRKGTDMESSYQAMVNTATWLGDTIGKALAEAVQGRGVGGSSTSSARESVGKAKGGLHRLRKTRTVADFVNELARLQLRYGIDVPKDALDGTTFTPESFEDFRGFCVVAALNKFQFLTRRGGPLAASTPTTNS
jgi:hypothetical protein